MLSVSHHHAMMMGTWTLGWSHVWLFVRCCHRLSISV